jgi:APA family basic amino acid/polyamine antiporter
MIGVGAMIGTSIFVLIGVTIDEVGPAILLVFLLNVIVTTFTAGVYAELGSTFPEAGGGYLWAKRALKHPGAFLTGWMTWFAHTVACSYYGLGFGYAMVAFSHSFGVDFFGLTDEMVVKLFAVLAILFFVFVNYSGVGATGRTGDIITLVQILIISFFVAFMVMYALDINGIHMMDNFDPFFPEGTHTGKILMMMGFTFIAFEGYDIIVQCGEEVKNPKKNIPRAIFISVAVVAVLYLSVAFACLANPDADWRWVGSEGENAVISSARMVIPFVGAPVVILGSLLSAMAALNATVFSSSRVSFAMGRDRTLPRLFGMIHKTRNTPHYAITLTASIMLAMALFFPLDVSSAVLGGEPGVHQAQAQAHPDRHRFQDTVLPPVPRRRHHLHHRHCCVPLVVHTRGVVHRIDMDSGWPRSVHLRQAGGGDRLDSRHEACPAQAPAERRGAALQGIPRA